MKQKTGVSIKTALIGIVGVLIIVLMAVSISNVVKTSARKGEAARLMIANEMADYIIVAAGQQAIERGLTATVLSKETRTAGALVTKIKTIRERGDKAFNKAVTMAKTLTVMDATNKPLKAALARLTRARARAVEARKRADSNMGVAHKEFPPTRWIFIMSKMIESGANLRMVAITSPATSETLHKALRFNLVLKQAVWLASEYAGRERAILGGHIAGGKALSPERLETLKAYRGINELNINTILALKDDPETDPAILKSIGQLSAVFLGSFQKIREDVYASSVTGDYNISGAQWIKNATGGIDTILSVSRSVSEVVKTAINNEMAKLKTQMMMAVGLLLFAILLGIVAFFVIKSKILKPMKNLKEINGIINNIERTGDLSQRINIDSADETGEIAIAFNKMIEKFYHIVREIQGSSALLATSSVELTSSATDISQGAKAQTGMATQVATASQEMSATIIDVARNASGAAEAARKANDTACNGTEIVNKTIESMNGIACTAKESSDVIRALGDRSKEIGNIIMVIDDIADQTNLLALNAAIEAARAGEQGRGFAVVADEVRKLAERTGSATKEIGEMIKTIQRETALAITTMDKEVAVVEDGVAFAGQAGSALSDILTQVEKVTMVIEQIATASEEQSVTADHISGDIEAVADITIGADKKAQKIVHASEAMSTVAGTLQKSVAMFKLSRSVDKSVATGVSSLEQVGVVSRTTVAVHASAPPIRQGGLTQQEKIQQLRDNLSKLAHGPGKNNTDLPAATYQPVQARDLPKQTAELSQEEKMRKLRDNLKEIADKKRLSQERIDEERIVLFNQEDLREEDELEDIFEPKVIN